MLNFNSWFCYSNFPIFHSFSSLLATLTLRVVFSFPSRKKKKYIKNTEHTMNETKVNEWMCKIYTTFRVCTIADGMGSLRQKGKVEIMK